MILARGKLYAHLIRLATPICQKARKNGHLVVKQNEVEKDKRGPLEIAKKETLYAVTVSHCQVYHNDLSVLRENLIVNH